MQSALRYLGCGSLVLCAGLMATFPSLDKGFYLAEMVVIGIGTVLIAFGAMKFFGARED